MDGRDYIDIADLDRNRLARAQYEREIGAIEARLAGDRNAGPSVFSKPEDNPRNNATIGDNRIHLDYVAELEEKERNVDSDLRATDSNIATYENLIATIEQRIAEYRETLLSLANENEEIGAQMRDVPVGPEGDELVREMGTVLERNREEIQNINATTIPDLEEQIENYRSNIGREKENRVNIEKRKNFYAEQQRKYIDAENQRDRARLAYLHGMIEALESAEREMLNPTPEVAREEAVKASEPSQIMHLDNDASLPEETPAIETTEEQLPIVDNIETPEIEPAQEQEIRHIDPNDLTNTWGVTTGEPLPPILGNDLSSSNENAEPSHENNEVEPAQFAPFTFDPNGTVIADDRNLEGNNKTNFEETIELLANLQEVNFEEIANDELQQRIFFGKLTSIYLGSDYHNFTEEQRVQLASALSVLGGLTAEHYYQLNPLANNKASIGNAQDDEDQLARDGAICIAVDLMDGLTDGSEIYPETETPNLIVWQEANEEKIKELTDEKEIGVGLANEDDNELENEAEKTKKPSIIGLIAFKVFKRPPYKIKEVATNPEYLQEYMEWKEKAKSAIKTGGIGALIGLVVGSAIHANWGGHEDQLDDTQEPIEDEEIQDELKEDENEPEDTPEIEPEDTPEIEPVGPGPNPVGPTPDPVPEQPNPQPDPPANPEPVDPVIPSDPDLPDPVNPEPDLPDEPDIPVDPDLPDPNAVLAPEEGIVVPGQDPIANEGDENVTVPVPGLTGEEQEKHEKDVLENEEKLEDLLADIEATHPTQAEVPTATSVPETVETPTIASSVSDAMDEAIAAGQVAPEGQGLSR